MVHFSPVLVIRTHFCFTDFCLKVWPVPPALGGFSYSKPQKPFGDEELILFCFPVCAMCALTHLDTLWYCVRSVQLPPDGLYEFFLCKIPPQAVAVSCKLADGACAHSAHVTAQILHGCELFVFPKWNPGVSAWVQIWSLILLKCLCLIYRLG